MKFPPPMSALALPLLQLLFLTSLAAGATGQEQQLTVQTATGTYTGLIDTDAFPGVRQFRSIAYAEPPIGARRWLAPVAAPASRRQFFARRFPPSCPQYQSRNLTAWTTNITDFAVRLYGQSFTAGAMAQASSEDCLYLAVWAPLLNSSSSVTTPTTAAANTTQQPLLPVALFLPGGDFVGGGVDVPYQRPAGLVAHAAAAGQPVIAVTANYRVNIAGFPWAAGLAAQNVGVLDMRAALEWVYANIAAFGGDPARITLWGQSAGGVAADLLAYAYPDDPLVAGLFLQSGTAMVNISYPDAGHTNFTFVARNVGCDFPSDPAAELACMRQVPMSLLQNFVGQYKDNGTRPSLTFKPVPDGERVFFNYTARTAAGRIARVPALVSTTSNEQSTLYRYPTTNVTAGPWQAGVDAATVGVFVCLASNTTAARARQGLTTYRYEYAGNFSSLTPLPWMGAYHASDVPMLFGTYGGRTGVEPFQRLVADAMQDSLIAFMYDAENGLRARGWLPHDQLAGSAVGGRNLMRFAAGGIVAQNVSAAQVDDACVLGTKYNSSP